MAEIKIKLYNFQGQELGEEVLDPKLFGISVKPEVVHNVVVARQANARKPIAHTKGRADVRGGGRKPWRQKGTGRARHGSIRSPLWVGGGVTFGPTAERNFSIKINKKIKSQALKMVLSDKVTNKNLILFDTYNLPAAKTKILKQTLDKLKIGDQKVLIVTKGAKDSIVLAARNLSKIKTIGYNSLNVVDLLKSRYLVINKELVKKLQEFYL